MFDQQKTLNNPKTYKNVLIKTIENMKENNFYNDFIKANNDKLYKHYKIIDRMKLDILINKKNPDE
jgi:hypothetical protein